MKNKISVPTESQSQIAVVNWFHVQYPTKVIFAIPNGAWLHGTKLQRIQQANKMKREGLLKGVSDLFIAVPRNGLRSSHGLFLEMKREGETASSISDEQRLFLDQMFALGFDAHWAAGFDQAKEIIEKYMKEVI